MLWENFLPADDQFARTKVRRRHIAPFAFYSIHRKLYQKTQVRVIAIFSAAHSYLWQHTDLAKRVQSSLKEMENATWRLMEMEMVYR